MTKGDPRQTGSQVDASTAGGAAPHLYQITVEAHLESSRWSRWFDDMQVRPVGDGTSVLSGVIVDQSALHGLLARVRDLGLVLISVQRVGEDTRPMHRLKGATIDEKSSDS